MDPRAVARSIALARLAAGATLVLAPRFVARLWLGRRHGDSDAASALGRALGVRDAVVGAMALHTLDHPEVAPRWQMTSAVIDAADAAATLAVRRSLPPTGYLVVAMAAAGAAGSAWAGRSLRGPGV